MGFSFYYEFSAPAETSAAKLERVLRDIEREAQRLGFKPTLVLNVPFDTPERRQVATRLGGSFTLQDERLKGVAIPATGQLRSHDPVSGECRLIPRHGVVLVITDDHGCETCFGFFKFPEHVIDIHGAIIAETGLNGRWWFRDFVSSPDQRYREIVNRFNAPGFVVRVQDEFI